MKTLAATFMLTIYLFASTEAGQLLKLPAIYQHYQEHCRSNASTDLLSFFSAHYWHPSGHQEKHPAKHQHLPFKSGRHLPVIPVAEPVYFTTQFPSALEANTVSKVTLHQSPLASFPGKDVFQPPRLA
ncbi:hypothetical protein JMG10_13755 [Nostoc ellipsosporum NOK]|jgi:hypothetical protein|nr:hypothetical protein [Nostoc ellipsosporum NOK]